MAHGRIYNFSAGPSMMPEEVLRKAGEEMLNYEGSGMSVMEMSHRSKVYDNIIVETEASARRIIGVPDNYKILFMHGGATGQFAAIPMNLMPKTGKADYAVTGNFSKNAAEEAKKYGEVSIAATSADRNFAYIPSQDALSLNKEASYFHYCMNNTIFGTKWSYVPDTDGVPVVSDMSSCILSEPIDVSKYGLIYAGAQKNMGPAGLAFVIIREDLAGSAYPYTPKILDYAVTIKSSSMYNTPPTYSIYVLGEILKWVDSMGGLSEMEKYNTEKASYIYNFLDNSALFKSTVDREARSIMNVTFKTGNEELDAKFVKEATASGFVNLKGHRSVGGMRASIYNAMPMDGTKALAEFMARFEKENG